MSTSLPPAERRSGLANVVDIVIAPNTAFERIRQVPVWGWAFLVAALLAIAGTLLAGPAVQHAIETGMPATLAASDNIAKLPPDQQQKQIAAFVNVYKNIAKFSWILIPVWLLLVGVIQGVVMLIANAATRGTGSFKQYFALSITVAVAGIGLSSLVLGVIVMLRGANSFETTTAVQSAIPSLGLLAPSAKGALAGFLGALNVFVIWATVLLAFGMQRVGRIPRGPAWATAIIMLLLTACFAAYGAKQNG
ncbi:MAG TPA: YIP1 family protein [Candidatus Elarobacter sp.]|nr:YIP1 family protein [Candidatus Elarobacter sp.]